MVPARVKDITGKIESLVETGDVRRGDIVKLTDLPKDLAILLQASYAGNRDYNIDREINIDLENPREETYTFYLKYVGIKNA